MPAGDGYGWSYVGMEGGIPTDPSQPGIFWQTRAGWLMRGVYQNPGAEVPQNTAAKITWTKFADVRTKFAAQYPGKLGPGGLVWMNGDWFTFQQRMYWQDSPGTVSIFSLSQGSFIGTMESWSKPTCRWCGLHSTVPVQASFPVANLVIQSLCGGGSTGPYSSKLTKAVAATDTVFQVDTSTPANEDPVNGPRTLQMTLPGDRVGVNGCHGGEQETMLVAAVSGTTWTMKRGSGAKAWPVGTRLVMIPNVQQSDFWYNPLTGALAPDPNQAGSHRATRQPFDMNADYSMRRFSSFNDLATKSWDAKWPWIIPGTETYPMVQHQRHPSVTSAGKVYDVYAVYKMSEAVTPMSPSMGGLLSWDLTQPSITNTATIKGRMLSSPIMPNLSMTGNVHPLANGKWVIGMGANYTAVFIYEVGSATPPPPSCDCCANCPGCPVCPTCPTCPVCPVCPPPECDCAALKTVVASQGKQLAEKDATIQAQSATIKTQADRIVKLERLIQDALAILNQWTQ